MERQKRLATLVSLWALTGISVAWSKTVAGSAIAPSICERLVKHMRGSPATVLKDESVPKMLPWIVNGVSRPAAGDPEYRHLWRATGGNGVPFSTIESLPGTALSMASVILGSEDCLQSAFFERKQASVFHAIASPPMAEALCGRLGEWGGLAAVLRQPTFIAYVPLNPDSMDSLLIITPWNGKSWGRACPVSIRFRYRYDVTGLYCGASEKVCDTAREVAPEVKRHYDAWIASGIDAFNQYGGSGPKFEFGGVPSTQGQALVARAERIGITFGDLAPGKIVSRAWLRHLSPYSSVYFPLDLDGNLYVGAASLSRRTAFVGSPRWLFILFQPPGARSQRLAPLAAFTVHRVTSGVRSITARNESAPASDMQSTKFPYYDHLRAETLRRHSRRPRLRSGIGLGKR